MQDVLWASVNTGNFVVDCFRDELVEGAVGSSFLLNLSDGDKIKVNTYQI